MLVLPGEWNQAFVAKHASIMRQADQEPFGALDENLVTV
jgi:hypothetical protein